MSDVFSQQLAARKQHPCPACGSPNPAFRPHHKHGDCMKCLKCGVFVVGEDDGLGSDLVWNRWAIKCREIRKRRSEPA